MKKYEIYLPGTPLLADDPVVEAKTAKEAILIALKESGKKINPKNLRRMAGRGAQFKATPFYERDGMKFRDGRDVWYGFTYN